MKCALLFVLSVVLHVFCNTRVVIEDDASTLKRITVSRSDKKAGIQGLTMFIRFESNTSVAAWPIRPSSIDGHYEEVRDENNLLLMLTNRPFDIAVPGMGFVDDAGMSLVPRSLMDQTTVSFLLTNMFLTYFEDIVILMDIRPAGQIVSASLSPDHISELYPDASGDVSLVWAIDTTPQISPPPAPTDDVYDCYCIGSATPPVQLSPSALPPTSPLEVQTTPRSTVSDDNVILYVLLGVMSFLCSCGGCCVLFFFVSRRRKPSDTKTIEMSRSKKRSGIRSRAR